jgi:DNA-binding IclR family transcriptional regulator
MVRPPHDTDARRNSRGSTPLVQSVARAIRIVGVLLRSREGERIADVARGLGLTKSTTHRILRTLESEGVVRRDPESGRYAVDPTSLVGAPGLVSGVASLRATVQDSLDDLAQSTGATAVLAFPDETRRNVVVGAYGLSPQPVRLDPSAMPAVPAHAIAPGKCFLAAMSDEELGELLGDELPRVTRSTITSLKVLMQQLAQARRRGYAICEQEAMIGICGLAVPVRDRAGVVVASLALGATSHALPRNRVRQWLPPLRTAAAAISELLYDTPQQK